MNKLYCILVLFLVFAFAQIASARTFTGGLSYIGSDFEKNKQLPYERCTIQHNLEGTSYNSKGIWSSSYIEFSKPSASLFANWKGMEPLHADYFLVCWVGVNNYAYAIPIHLGKLGFKGFALELMGDALKFDFEQLKGKTLADISGKYHGRTVAAGTLFMGVKHTHMRNKNKVKLKVHGWYAGLLGLEIGKSRFEIGLGQDVTKLVDKTNGDAVNDIKDILTYKFVRVKTK